MYYVELLIILIQKIDYYITNNLNSYFDEKCNQKINKIEVNKI
jgi:hypothetical protein